MAVTTDDNLAALKVAYWDNWSVDLKAVMRVDALDDEMVVMMVWIVVIVMVEMTAMNKADGLVDCLAALMEIQKVDCWAEKLAEKLAASMAAYSVY